MGGWTHRAEPSDSGRRCFPVLERNEPPRLPLVAARSGAGREDDPGACTVMVGKGWPRDADEAIIESRSPRFKNIDSRLPIIDKGRSRPPSSVFLRGRGRGPLDVLKGGPMDTPEVEEDLACRFLEGVPGRGINAGKSGAARRAGADFGGGEVMGRGQKSNLTRSSSVFQ